MCPHVLFGQDLELLRMWYSGGEQSEPNAIGYPTSRDGIFWTKHPDYPVFRLNPANKWERDRVTACQVLLHDGWFVMFYIGFRDNSHAMV